MDILDLVKIMLGISDTNKDELLNVLIDAAKNEFCNLTYQTEVPDSAANLIAEIVCEKYMRLGSRGLSSQSYSGLSQNYIDGYSKQIMKQLGTYRKAVLL